MRFTIIVCILLCLRLQAQVNGNYSMLSVNDGLSQGMVFDILEGSDGFLWIATKDGLNRFDGYGFEVFAPDAFDPFSIASSEIRGLYEDSHGWLWLTYEGGIDFFLPETGQAFHLPITSPESFNGYVHSIAFLPDGTAWMECDSALWKIEATADILEKAGDANQAFPDIQYVPFSKLAVDIPAGLRFYSIFFSKDKTLLTGTSNGVYRIEQQGSRYHLIPEAMQGKQAHLIGEDHAGRLWMHTFDELWVRESRGKSFEKVRSGVTWEWYFDSDGNLWNRHRETIRKWLPEQLAAGGSPAFETPIIPDFSESPSFYFTDVEIDRSGNVWVGTSGYGLVKINPRKPKFKSYLPQITMRRFYEDPDGNLFNILSGQAFFSDKNFDRNRANPWLEKIARQLFVTALAFDHQGNCWVKSWYGEAYRIDAATKEIATYPMPGSGLFCNRNGNLLSLEADALYELNPITKQVVKHPCGMLLRWSSDAAFHSNLFYQGNGENIWALTAEGLLQITPEGAGYQFQLFQNDPADRSSLANNTVLAAAEDPLEPRRYLWVGTKGGGLNRLDLETGKFKHFTTRQGLPDNVVYGILTDGAGHLWISTNKGLCRFHVREETVKNFTAADGLQDNEFNHSSYLKTRDGTLIFGGVNGLTVFHPDSLRFNLHKPRTVFTRLWVNNEPVYLRQTPSAREGAVFLKKNSGQNYRLELSHRQNLVTFEFAALEFTNPTQNQYRYQLVRHHTFGKDAGEGWVDLDTRNSIQFANLRPGSYTFRVVGSNNDGTWGEEPAVLVFTIRPPWWASGWAYLMYALVIAAGVWAFYRYQLHRKLEARETLRLRELDDFKNRFFTNITHEFRTPLTVILGNLEIEKQEIEKLEKLENWKTGKASSVISQFLNFQISKNTLTRRSAENLLRLINQILDLAKLESNTLKINYVQGDVVSYLRYITESLHSLANAQNVMLRVDSAETEIVMDYDPERLLQIVHNLLSNAIKFTPSGGRVTMKLEIGNWEIEKFPISQFLISVSDTGCGIPPEDLPFIFDRFYQADSSVSARSANRAAGGTGIGLALTRELVKAMGGEISVESEPGKGTTFTVKLPATQSPLTPKGEPQSSQPVSIFEKISSELPGVDSPLEPVPNLLREGRGESSEGTPSIHQSTNPSILIIEDNPDVMEYLVSCLHEKYRLDFAYNGRAGIEKALETVPDLIVSDVMMPEKDGFEVCETLKNDERTSHIPIVLLTAKAGVENRIAGLRRGADVYLAKPFHREELLVNLANLLDLRKKLQAKYYNLQSPISSLQPPVTDLEDAFVQKVKTAILDRLSDPSLTVEKLSRALALSQSQLHRKLTALTGKNATQFIRAIRLARAMELLKTGDMNVSEVAYAVGFDDPKYFSRVFGEEFGMPPSKI